MIDSATVARRTSVQIMLFAAVVALFANSAVDRTDDGLPWEITLTGFCLFGVIFSAIYANKIEIALSIIWFVAAHTRDARCQHRDPS